MKKTFEELAAIREAYRADMNLRNETNAPVKVSVSMSTCGINAGARDVLNFIAREVHAKGLTDHVAVLQKACIGLCQYEPVVVVEKEGENKVTYIHMDEEKVKKMVEDHLVRGEAVADYILKENK